MFFFLTMQSKISLALLPNSCFFRLKKTAAALDGRSLISGLCIAYLASHKHRTVAVQIQSFTILLLSRFTAK